MNGIAEIFVKMKEEINLYKSTIKVIDDFIKSFEEGENAEKTIKSIQAEIYRLKIFIDLGGDAK